MANLLDNAVKYTRAGGQITVSVTQDDSHVTVAVRDTGIGIAEEDLPHIFDRFYRAEKSRSEPGSGLGLSLAKAFVSAHDGRIAVTTSPGKKLHVYRNPARRDPNGTLKLHLLVRLFSMTKK